MCLVDRKRVRYADHDIPIFKVVIEQNGQYYSPYRYDNRLWRVNSVDFNIVEEALFNPYYQEFGRGYFHAYTNEDIAYRMLPFVGNNIIFRLGKNQHLKVVSGYIPEGTRYAVESDWNEICAHKMILNI